MQDLRLVIVIDRFTVLGGAQKVIADQANFWDTKGWKVDLMSLEDPVGGAPAFPLNSGVKFTSLATDERIVRTVPYLTRLRRLLYLRRSILARRPNVVLGIMPVAATKVLQALAGSRIPVIAVEHCDPASQPLPETLVKLRRRLYPKAASVVCLNERAMGYFSEKIQSKGAIIPNAVTLPTVTLTEANLKREPGRKYAIFVGRLDPIQKRVDRLITAFAAVAGRHPEWILELWGEGEDRDNLHSLIQAKELSSQVRLMGPTRCPFAVMRASHLLLLTSEFEGMPLVIGEAMAAGLPVVTFDCPTGPREMIRHEVDGILVPNGDVTEFAKALERIFTDEPLRLNLALKAPEVLNRFSLDKIMSMWCQTITVVANA